MMELFRTWLLGLVTAALILTALYALIPVGKLRSTVRVTGSLVLLLVLLQPLAQMDPGWHLPSYETYSSQIEEQIAAYQEENLKRTETIIAERTAAYISDKGLELGVVCAPAVETRVQDGVPYPYRVIMDIPHLPALSDYIAEQLGIPADRQAWQER